VVAAIVIVRMAVVASDSLLAGSTVITIVAVICGASSLVLQLCLCSDEWEMDGGSSVLG
jgi:hypothetical protein